MARDDDLTLAGLYDVVERLRSGETRKPVPLLVPAWVLDDPEALEAALQEARLWGFDGVAPTAPIPEDDE